MSSVTVRLRALVTLVRRQGPDTSVNIDMVRAAMRNALPDVIEQLIYELKRANDLSKGGAPESGLSLMLDTVDELQSRLESIETDVRDSMTESVPHPTLRAVSKR